jgi:hypothetical protein
VFASQFHSRARSEGQLLSAQGVDIVVGDIPPLAFAAASCAGLPSLAVGNFGWDWIFGAWPDFEDIIECIQYGYRQADTLLRLPLHSRDDFVAFREIIDVPLIARTARQSRSVTRSELGLAADRQVVLLSFGAFDARGLDLQALGALADYTFVVTPPLSDREVPRNVLALRQQPPDYVSLLAACDAAITKPGYGIVADCLANRVPVLFTDRGPFREYDVLADALLTHGKARYVPRAALLAGDVGDHLADLLAQPHSWSDMALNGATVVADKILQCLTATRAAAS